MLATHGDALLMQLIEPHSGAHERVFPMPCIQWPHHVQITRRHGLGQIIDATPANIEQVGLTADRQLRVTAYPRFALSNPALLSAPSKKSFSNAQLADLGMKRLQINGGRC
jgi:hypothetical protein